MEISRVAQDVIHNPPPDGIAPADGITPKPGIIKAVAAQRLCAGQQVTLRPRTMRERLFSFPWHSLIKLVAEIQRRTDMDINKHPALTQYYSVCMLVEALPASTASTEVSVALSDLGEKIESLIDEKDAEIERLKNKKWNSVTDCLPERDFPVIAAFKNSYGYSRVVRATYYRENQLELDCDSDPWDGCTHNAESDMWYAAPGWYEENELEETHWRICDKVTHWMPLPDYPIEAGEGEG
jgi:hypothetical protein